MTKNDITWHSSIGSDGSRICQSGADHGERAARAYITGHTVPAGRSDPLHHVAPPNLKASCSFCTKEGSKVKDIF